MSRYEINSFRLSRVLGKIIQLYHISNILISYYKIDPTLFGLSKIKMNIIIRYHFMHFVFRDK